MTDELQYSLKFQVLTDMPVAYLVTEHEVNNKITFSTVHPLHGLPLPGCLSPEPMQ